MNIHKMIIKKGILSLRVTFKPNFICSNCAISLDYNILLTSIHNKEYNIYFNVCLRLTHNFFVGGEIGWLFFSRRVELENMNPHCAKYAQKCDCFSASVTPIFPRLGASCTSSTLRVEFRSEDWPAMAWPNPMSTSCFIVFATTTKKEINLKKIFNSMGVCAVYSFFYYSPYTFSSGLGLMKMWEQYAWHSHWNVSNIFLLCAKEIHFSVGRADFLLP